MMSRKTKTGPDVTRTLQWKRMMPLALVIALAMTMSGCSRTKEVKGSLFPSSSTHVSPPPVTVPRLPPGTFDADQGHAEREQATAMRLAHDAAGARGHAEKATQLWPADLSAWDELKVDCVLLNDLTCQRYADFFRAKVQFVATLPPRVAVLGFASLNAAGTGVKSGDYVYDQQTLDTALHLASFYDEQDQLRGVRMTPTKTSTPAAK